MDKVDMLEMLANEYLDLLEEAARLEKRATEKRRKASVYATDAIRRKAEANQTRKIMHMLGNASVSIFVTIRMLEKEREGRKSK